MDYLAELIELYEYKVADVIAGRTPRGGRHALNDLRRELLSLDLDPLLRRRLMQSERQFRDWRRQLQAQGQHHDQGQQGQIQRRHQIEYQGEYQGEGAAGEIAPTPQLAPVPDTAFAWKEPLSESEESALAAWRLETLAWHAEVVQNLRQATQDMRYEPQHPTLRVMYAVIENAERSQRGVTERFSVPTADDPLVSLGNKEVVDDLTTSLTQLLLTPGGQQQVMTTLSEVRENPFPLNAKEEAVRAQLAAAEREHMTPQAREELLRALRAQLPKAPDPRERPAIREASIRLQRLLEDQLRRLPAKQTTRRVLFAPSAHPLMTPDDQASQLLIDLDGAQQETRWHGMPIRWQAAGPNWQLQVDQQVMMLYPHLGAADRTARLNRTELFYEGHYLLLQLRGDAQADLGLLAAQARAVSLLLSPSGDFANLRLARAAAQHLRGAALNLAALTPESAQKFAQAAPDDLQEFVRQGLGTVLSRIESLTPAEIREALNYCAQALELSEARAGRLHEVLHNALHNPDQISALAFPAIPGGARLLRAGGQFQSFQMTSEPLTIGIKDRAITLRWDYKNDLTVLIPGLPSLVVRDLLVVPLSDMDLMFVRQGQQIALAAVVHQPAVGETGLEEG